MKVLVATIAVEDKAAEGVAKWLGDFINDINYRWLAGKPIISHGVYEMHQDEMTIMRANCERTSVVHE